MYMYIGTCMYPERAGAAWPGWLGLAAGQDSNLDLASGLAGTWPGAAVHPHDWLSGGWGLVGALGRRITLPGGLARPED